MKKSSLFKLLFLAPATSLLISAISCGNKNTEEPTPAESEKPTLIQPKPVNPAPALDPEPNPVTPEPDAPEKLNSVESYKSQIEQTRVDFNNYLNNYANVYKGRAESFVFHMARPEGTDEQYGSYKNFADVIFSKINTVIDGWDTVVGNNVESAKEEYAKINKMFSTFVKGFNKQLAAINPPTYSLKSEMTIDEVREHFKEVVQRVVADKNEDHSNDENYKQLNGRINYDKNGYLIPADTYYEVVKDFLKSGFRNFKQISLVATSAISFEVTPENKVYGILINANDFRRNDMNQVVDKYVENALSLVDNSMNTYEKVYVLGKYVLENLIYKTKPGTETMNSLDFAYIEHKGVCRHYVDQMALLLSNVNIPYKVMQGDYHTWLNIQNEDGKWFSTDPTHADTGKAEKYFPLGKSGEIDLDFEMKNFFNYQNAVTTDFTLFDLKPNDGSNEAINFISQEMHNSLFNKWVYKLKDMYANGEEISSLNYNNHKLYFVSIKDNQPKLQYVETNKTIPIENIENSIHTVDEFGSLVNGLSLKVLPKAAMHGDKMFFMAKNYNGNYIYSYNIKTHGLKKEFAYSGDYKNFFIYLNQNENKLEFSFGDQNSENKLVKLFDLNLQDQ
ncbi:transglutaminase domain-containing protein [Mycoplasma sp. 21DD0573]|uniref:transglutaminase-like domain-containing protein n=1 Tax=unclassified Mycoplasma TaxID=2683645 RepID=UPI002B1CFD44|nr:transglutaminase domain-containing protein [Mycoplasma sp. 21DD0573]MEA4276241.1 transglutaminase domain-containing protein [Mycoplasma sp. 21DD0573]